MTPIFKTLSNLLVSGKVLIRRLLEPTSFGYKILLVRKGYSMIPRSPNASGMNKVLKERSEVDKSLAQLSEIGLLPHIDPPKNWDSLAALDYIIKYTANNARVLDAGGAFYSPLVEWLFMYGYRSLYAVNLSFKRDVRHGSIKYMHGDCTATRFPPEYFDVVTCLSVIEHGVDLSKFLKESFRILRPGGHLIVSTDYWKERVYTNGKIAFGAPVKIFTQEEIEEFIASAESIGFKSTGPVDYSTGSRVVHWKDYGLDYTFIVFALVKSSTIH